jgi:NADPH:quinone reductase-like Zn-dependent oxidoreductase
MKAAFHHRYGPPEVLRIREVPHPEPRAGEVLVRIHASTVTSGDARIRGFRTPAVFWLPLRLAMGATGPRNPIPGMEFAGEVAALGPGAGRFRVGQPVFGLVTRGANAEYLALREDAAIAPIPPGLGFAEAASVPFGALTALGFLRDVARVQPGEHVLVAGAAGAVGCAAVQVARHLGARVSGLCGGDAAGLVRALGAGTVHDRHAMPLAALPGGHDVILDTIGTIRPAEGRRLLGPRGRHVFVSFGARELAAMAWTAAGRGRRVLCGFSGETQADLGIIAAMLAAGTLRPVIAGRMALDGIVAAHRLVDAGRKRGSLVIDIAPGG